MSRSRSDSGRELFTVRSLGVHVRSYAGVRVYLDKKLTLECNETRTRSLYSKSGMLGIVNLTKGNMEFLWVFLNVVSQCRYCIQNDSNRYVTIEVRKYDPIHVAVKKVWVKANPVFSIVEQKHGSTKTCWFGNVSWFGHT